MSAKSQVSTSFKYQELAICVVGIYVCFLTWGITQERVSTNPYNGQKFKYFIFLNACQAVIATIVSYIYILIKNSKPDALSRPVVIKYIQLAIFHCIASPFGYAALKHIDYPTVILGKSCKLIPVMFMNFILYRKYIIVILITVGVSAFTLFQPNKKQSNVSSSLYGIALLMINLLIDGATNSTQDAMFKAFKVTGTSMMMYLNAFSSVFMFTFLIFNPYSTELSSAIAFCTSSPPVIFDIILFGFCGALGQCFIFHTLQHFGALVLVTTTVTRKMFSILLSVLYFGHSLNIGQWSSVGLVFVAIIWESFGKTHDKKAHVHQVITDNGPSTPKVTKATRRSSRKSANKKK